MEDWRDAIRAAVNQGAFIMWNHPGWQQPNIIPIWYVEHEEIYKNGWMHGVEIVNEREYYPLAQKWCIDKNITMVGNSDIHTPANLFFDFEDGGNVFVLWYLLRKEQRIQLKKQCLTEGRQFILIICCWVKKRI